MVDTRYNPDNGEAEWKEQGADTWHPFSELAVKKIYEFTGLDNVNITLSSKKNHIILFIQDNAGVQDAISTTNLTPIYSIECSGASWSIAYRVNSDGNFTITEHTRNYYNLFVYEIG